MLLGEAFCHFFHDWVTSQAIGVCACKYMFRYRYVYTYTPIYTHTQMIAYGNNVGFLISEDLALEPGSRK